jgi:hypothetical protein
VIGFGEARGSTWLFWPHHVDGGMYVFTDAMAESAEEITPLKPKHDEFGKFLSKVSMRVSYPCYGPHAYLYSLYRTD